LLLIKLIEQGVVSTAGYGAAARCLGQLRHSPEVREEAENEEVENALSYPEQSPADNYGADENPEIAGKQQDQ
jgi:hypothetical protein